jgi:hypothetical protein
MAEPFDAVVDRQENRLDYTLLLMGQVAKILDSKRGSAERYNSCMELAVLLHPYQDADYNKFAAEFFKKPLDQRPTAAWLQALMDLMYRSGFLGRGGGGD